MDHQKAAVKSEPQDDCRRPDEAPVEILGLPDAEGVRNDAEEQASECSSSFANTDDESFDSAEVQSAERNGNGALPNSPDESRKKALNLDWRSYRRGIEWRCRWLDLRLMQLQRQAIKYDEALAKLRKSKAWDSTLASHEEAGAARACPMPSRDSFQPLLHRHKRRRVEEVVEVAEYMSTHPLFQRYEKRKREATQESMQPKDSNELGEDSKARAELQDEDEGGAPNEGTVENVMLSLEILQARVIKLRNQLRGSMSHKLPGQLARAAVRGNPVPKAVTRPRSIPTTPAPVVSSSPAAAAAAAAATAAAAVAAAGAAKGSPALRRRSSDFDMNNVMLPAGFGSKQVEHLRHVHIETPQWRSAENPSSSDPSGGNALNEDTDDETYRVRHEEPEARERSNSYAPGSNKKAADGESGSSGKGTGSQQMQCSLSSQFSEG